MNKKLELWKTSLMVVLICFISFSDGGAQTPQGTSLTYQGRLNDGGNPANGLYDFEFTLYDGPDPSLDKPVSLTISASNVQVTEGLFTVELDFTDIYSGEACWLEIKVGPAGGSLTQLLPTQLLTSVPYAVHALSIGDTGVTAGTYGSETVIPRLTIGSDGRIDSVTAEILDPRDGDFNASNELNTALNLSGTQLRLADAGGTLTAELSSLVNDADASPTNELNTALSLTGTQLQLTDAGGTLTQDLSSLIDDADWDWVSGSGLTGTLYRTGNVGIGTSSVSYPFVVEMQAASNINPLAVLRTTGSGSAAAIRYMNATGNHFNLGITGADEFALAYNMGVSTVSDLMRVTSTGNVGFGTVSPQYRLHVVSGQAYGGYFDSTATTGSAQGLHARAEGAAGGAVGTNHYGLYGSAKNAYNNVGVYGEASVGTNNYGGYFSGMLYASGNTGIGKTIPTAKLHVVQTNATEALRIEDETSDPTPFVIDENGQVGIRTQLPLAPLQVGGDALVDGNFGVGTTATSAKTHILQTSAANAFRVDDETSDTTPFVIDQNGQVGIGVSLTLAKTHIVQEYYGDALRVDDEEDDTTPFIITDSGRVGIGTETPQTAFDLEYNDRTVLMGEYEGSSDPNYYYISSLNSINSSETQSYLALERRHKTSGVSYRYGVRAEALDSDSYRNFGIYAQASNASDENYAGYFAGDVFIQGTLAKAAGSFKIDHPLDPENKYLQHSFVESPDMMNVYNGNIVLDGRGEAVITLPAWFEALNKDFRYQLTCIGGFAPIYIASEITDNSFSIAGGTPGLKVSWQVTGVRQDPYAQTHPIPVELDKNPADQGRYLNPEAYGYNETMGIGY